MASRLAMLLLEISVVSLLQTGLGLPEDGPDWNDCDSINYSIDTSHENKTVIIAVASRIKSMNVILYGDVCKLSCSFYRCKEEPTVYKNVFRTEEEITEKFIFPNVTSKYFCGTISAGNCAVGTDTISHPIVIVPPDPPPESKVNVLIILGSVFCLFLVAIFALVLSMKKPSHRLVVPSDESDAPVDTIFPEFSTALLLYSRDSSAFLNLMAAFRDLLVNDADIQVLDPLDSSRFEEVARNPSGWLSRQLVNPSTKVILVVSDVAILRQRALLSNRQVETPEPHFLDGIFTQALRHLHDNPYDSSNYDRIFTVRFDDVMTKKENLSLIVPLRCFNMPKHLANLICEVKGLPCDQFESMEEDLQRSPALARLHEQLRLAAIEKHFANVK